MNGDSLSVLVRCAPCITKFTSCVVFLTKLFQRVSFRAAPTAEVALSELALVPTKITLISGVAAPTHHRRDGDCQSAGLQLETLGGTAGLCTTGACLSTTTGLRTRFGRLPLGRGNWLFAGLLRTGQRAAAVMSLIQSAKLDGHDPYAYLKDVLARLPTYKNNLIKELPPHRWMPPTL